MDELEVKLVQEDSIKKDQRPTLMKWKGENMMRVHSVMATVKEILNVSQALDLVKIGIIGEPSTGKTTLAKTLAHIIHKTSDIPWAIRIFGEEEFLHLKETLLALDSANYVIIFDDLSFLANKRAIEEVKQVVTKIRHLREDVRIILIYNYHYTLGFDKYLRQANFFYFTSVGSSEFDNMIKLVGTKYVSRIRDFQKKFVEMTTRFKCTFRIGPKKFFAYNYKNPFVNCIFFNNQRLRYVIFPQREWIDKICSICSSATGQLLKSEISVSQFRKESEQKFGERVFASAVKLKLFSSGMNVYAASVVQGQKYLDRALEKKLISLEELATDYGFEITRTKLRKKLDGVLAS